MKHILLAVVILIAVPAFAQDAQDAPKSPAQTEYCAAHPRDNFCTTPSKSSPVCDPTAWNDGKTEAECLADATKPADSKTSGKNISFAFVLPDGSIQMSRPDWIENWIRKNTKKYPDITFSQSPSSARANFVIVFTDSETHLNGWDAVVVTSTTPVSGSGYVSDRNGDTWRFSYYGTVTTTSTSEVPYDITTTELVATAFNQSGAVIGTRRHVSNVKRGGDPYNSLGFNIGNALHNINARGRMLNGLVKNIAGVR